MKLITAIINPDRLDHVREALIQADITRITVSRVTGHGRQEDIDIYRGQKIAPNLIPKIRIDIAVNEEFVERPLMPLLIRQAMIPWLLVTVKFSSPPLKTVSESVPANGEARQYRVKCSFLCNMAVARTYWRLSFS